MRIMEVLQYLKGGINRCFAGREPWQIVSITTSSVLIVIWCYDILFLNEDRLVERLKKGVFRIGKKIPYIKRKIESELEIVLNDFTTDVEERTKHLTYITELPNTGLSKDDILKVLGMNLNMGEFEWKKGLVSGSVYCFREDLIDLITKVYHDTSYTNPLHPDLFPGLSKMEAEVVRIAANLFNGDENACGCVTSGGTESILMACKAYRDYGKEINGIKRPEIVAPITAHSAFDKAAQYLKMRLTYVKVDPQTYQVDIKAFKRAITSNTVMIFLEQKAKHPEFTDIVINSTSKFEQFLKIILKAGVDLLVGSCPNFPYGTMDDISAISELGLKYRIPVHVDSCLGGFLTCFMEDAGHPIPICDFRLPGVTSISADTHKYGFSPKGSSVILYRDKKYRHHQYTITTDWPGGVYGSPSVCGSRAGGNIAVCWATLLFFGKEGYVKSTRDIIHTAKYIEKGLKRIKGIFVFGTPVTSVIAIGSTDFDIYRLSSELKEKGWNLNTLQFPSAIHICVTLLHTQPGVADRFLKDVKFSVMDLMKNPSAPVEGKMALYGVAQQLPDRSIVVDLTRLFLDSLLYIPKKK